MAKTGIVNQGNFTRMRMQMEYCMNNTESKKGALGSNCIPKEDTVDFMKGPKNPNVPYYSKLVDRHF